MCLFALWYCKNSILSSFSLRYHRNDVHDEESSQYDEPKEGLICFSPGTPTIKSMIKFEAWSLQHRYSFPAGIAIH